MTKYIKIAVDDDFDEVDTVYLNDRLTATGSVWEPQYTKVLDYGFVGIVDFMGDDMSIVNAARVSYGRGTKKVNSDEGLVRYLMRHRHTTPFEMVDFKFHVKAPIFVFRQWHRHRTFSINEYSGRYSEMTDEMYQPTQKNLKPQSGTNRQGRSEDMLTDHEYTAVMSAIDHIFEESFQAYKHILGPNEQGGMADAPTAIQERIHWCKDAAVRAAAQSRKEALEGKKDDPFPTEESLEELIETYFDQNGIAELKDDFPGVAREIARIVLPVATYSQMYWKGNLHNLFNFLALRCDAHAQYEIRVYADAILDLIEPYVPWAVKAFKDYGLEGTTLSKAEIEVIRGLILAWDDGTLRDDLKRDMKDRGASPREIREFLEKVNGRN